jgi:hypothetical protein
MRKIKLTRGSASMADDINDNILDIEVNEDWLIDKILAEILRINYLPKIQGGKATWSVAYDNFLAIIAQEWEAPKILRTRFPFTIDNKYKHFDRLHFTYFGQEDPFIVYDILGRFKTVY